MSRIRIPPVLRDVVGGARELEASGPTVGRVLDDLFASHPALRDRLSEAGRLSPFVNVYVNHEDIRHRDGLDTEIRADDVVILLPAMAGGSVERPSQRCWDWPAGLVNATATARASTPASNVRHTLDQLLSEW